MFMHRREETPAVSHKLIFVISGVAVKLPAFVCKTPFPPHISKDLPRVSALQGMSKLLPNVLAGDALHLSTAASVLNAVRRAAPRLYRSHGNIIWPNNDKIRYRIPRVTQLIFKGERGDFETQAHNAFLSSNTPECAILGKHKVIIG